MSAPFKLLCPMCQKVMKVPQQPPVKARCPSCNAKVLISANGKVEIVQEVPGAALSTLAPPPPPPLSLAAPPRRNRAFIAVLVVLLLGALGAGGWWVVNRLGKNDPSPVVVKGDPKVDAAKDGKGVPKVDPKVPAKVDPKPDPEKKDVEYISVIAEAKGDPLPAGVDVVLVKAGAGFPDLSYKHSRKAVSVKESAVPGVDQARVNRAVDLGLEYLRAARAGDERLGAQALVGWTLLSCGAKSSDVDVQAVARLVRERAVNHSATYDVSAAVWFLDKLGAKEDHELLRTLGLRLVAGQKGRGGWGYTCPLLSRDQEDALVQFLEGKGGAEGKGELFFLSRPQLLVEAGVPVFQDNSNTQFAVLALWACRKYAVPVERALELVERRFRLSQLSQGSWSYVWLDTKTGEMNQDSMTCAGLLGLAVGKGRELGKMPEAKEPVKKDGPGDPAIEKALAFLGKRLQALGGTLSEEAQKFRGDILKVEARLADGANREEVLAQLKQMRVEWAKLAPGVPFPASGADPFSILPKGIGPGPGPLPPGPPPGPMPPKGILPPGMPPGGVPGFPPPGPMPPVLGGQSSYRKIIGADAVGDLYFLWSLERMAVVYDLRTIGKTDWYAWGANLIVNSQLANGRWECGYGNNNCNLPDTCFALLFLRRANAVQDLTVVLHHLSVSKNAGERGQGQGPSTGVVKGLQ